MSLGAEIFQKAIELLGDPIGEWEFIGIEYDNHSPYLKYYPIKGQVSISLSEKAKDDKEQFIFQLSHEMCHLFYPKYEYPSLIEHKTLLINEGISTYFSIKCTDYYCKSEDIIKDNLKRFSQNYFEAFILVEELLSIEPMSIKILRDKQPRIDLLKDKDFEDLNIPFNSNLVSSLIKPFE